MCPRFGRLLYMHFNFSKELRFHDALGHNFYIKVMGYRFCAYTELRNPPYFSLL